MRAKKNYLSLCQPYDLTRFFRVEMSVMFDIRNLLIDLARSGQYESYLDTIVAFLDETDEHYLNPRKDSKKFDYSDMAHYYGKEEIKDK